jgi:hypothetical protein
MNAEFIITFISIVAGLLGIYSYYQSKIEFKDFKEHAVNTFNNAKKRNIEVLNELKNYSIKNNCLSSHFMQGFTYNEAIEMLEKSLDFIFNKENLVLCQFCIVIPARIKRESNL